MQRRVWICHLHPPSDPPKNVNSNQVIATVANSGKNRVLGEINGCTHEKSPIMLLLCPRHVLQNISKTPNPANAFLGRYLLVLVKIPRIYLLR